MKTESYEEEFGSITLTSFSGTRSFGEIKDSSDKVVSLEKLDEGIPSSLKSNELLKTLINCNPSTVSIVKKSIEKVESVLNKKSEISLIIDLKNLEDLLSSFKVKKDFNLLNQIEKLVKSFPKNDLNFKSLRDLFSDLFILEKSNCFLSKMESLKNENLTKIDLGGYNNLVYVRENIQKLFNERESNKMSFESIEKLIVEAGEFLEELNRSVNGFSERVTLLKDSLVSTQLKSIEYNFKKDEIEEDGSVDFRFSSNLPSLFSIAIGK